MQDNDDKQCIWKMIICKPRLATTQMLKNMLKNVKQMLKNGIVKEVFQSLLTTQ